MPPASSKIYNLIIMDDIAGTLANLVIIVLANVKKVKVIRIGNGWSVLV